MRQAHLARHARRAALAHEQQQTALVAWMAGPASRGAGGSSGATGSNDDDLALEQAVSELISLRREVRGQLVSAGRRRKLCFCP